MNITIVGGGNIGTQFAVHCAEKEHEVIIYTSTPELYNGYLNIVNENGLVTHEGYIKVATSDPEIAFRDAELILITMPSTMMDSIAAIIYEHTNKQALIGVVPGNGGSECAFKKCILRGNTFFSIERVPAIARLITKGKTVRSTGYRSELHVASLPARHAALCADIVESIFDIKTITIPNILNLTMTPSNPILHTTRLKTIFNDWYEGKVYKKLPLFYEEWDDSSSELLIECDDEVQNICLALPEIDLKHVKSLRDHYESPDVHTMTKKISSIPAFKGLKTPAISVQGGFIPDLNSRYFTADFSYGLIIIQQIARFAGVETPYIDSIMEWYEQVRIVKDEFVFANYGFFDKENLFKFYSL